jgi:hypothetical protein
LGAFFAPQKTGLSAPIFFAAMPQKRISAAIPCAAQGLSAAIALSPSSSTTTF